MVWWDIFLNCAALKNIEVDEQNTNILAEGNKVKNVGITGACGEPKYGEYGDKGYGSYGVKYTYNEKTKTLTISGTGSIVGTYSSWDNEEGKLMDSDFLTISPHREIIMQEMEHLVIKDGIIDIGENAFKSCKALKTISFGNSIENISTGAFKACNKLEKVSIGKAMKYVSYSAFVSCPKLKQITVHKANKNLSTQGNLLLNKKKTELIWGCFVSNTTCRISSKIKDINKYVVRMKTIEKFEVDSKNKKYSSKNGLLYSKDGKTLYLCPRGKKGTATVSAKATKIDNFSWSYAFQNCSKLQKIVIGKNVKTLPVKTFSGCSNLQNVQINKNNKYYTSKKGAIFTKNGKKIIYCYAAENGTYTIPEGVTSIEDGAFSYCAKLKYLVLADSMTHYIPSGLGYDASKETKLESITLGKNYYNGGKFQFLKEALYLKNIYVSEENPYYSSVDGVVYNKEHTKLLACPGNKEICKMPDTVTSVASDAFYSNKNIKELYVSDKVMAIINELKQCDGLKKFYIGKNVKAVKRSLLTELEEILVNPENPYYKVENGMLYTKDGSSLIWCPEQSQGTVTIASGTAIIEEDAFYGCKKVTDVVIPATVTKIEEDAFGSKDDTGMENVVFWVPAGMKKYYQDLLNRTNVFKDGMVIKEMA